MQRLNRDTLCAIAVLVITGVFIHASFRIRDVDYGALKPVVWPQVILGLMLILGLVYLWQSLTRGELGSASLEGGKDEGPTKDYGPGLAGWLRKYRNPLACYALYLLFLLTLPYLGTLAGGILLVFLLLSVLGGWSARQIATHAAIAVISIGAMWSLFTYALGVLLPRGELFALL